jgi:hypothetical protein
LTNSHIRGVNVGAFFSVNLDADKRRIQKLSNLLVLKAFFLHNMAPMARGVTDA